MTVSALRTGDCKGLVPGFPPAKKQELQGWFEQQLQLLLTCLGASVQFQASSELVLPLASPDEGGSLQAPAPTQPVPEHVAAAGEPLIRHNLPGIMLEPLKPPSLESSGGQERLDSTVAPAPPEAQVVEVTATMPAIQVVQAHETLTGDDGTVALQDNPVQVLDRSSEQANQIQTQRPDGGGEGEVREPEIQRVQRRVPQADTGETRRRRAEEAPHLPRGEATAYVRQRGQSTTKGPNTGEIVRSAKSPFLEKEREFHDPVARTVRLIVDRGKQSEVTVKLAVHQNEVTGRLSTVSRELRQELQAGLEGLKQQLADSGFRADGLEVDGSLDGWKTGYESNAHGWYSAGQESQRHADELAKPKGTWPLKRQKQSDLDELV
ncbi:MAG TPA: flagellar hook-length control protein FliK [Firmicutes bacterium]|nr:flagellar hook-length control protein FliK [Bacillota bacterium]